MVQPTVRDAGAGTTATAAAAVTVTCTGIATDTPVPVNAMLPLYVPAALNDAVLKVIDRLAGLDWLTLKLVADSPIQVWLALAVSDTDGDDVVLNCMVCAAGAVAPMVQLVVRDAGAGVTVTAAAGAGERYWLKLGYATEKRA